MRAGYALAELRHQGLLDNGESRGPHAGRVLVLPAFILFSFIFIIRAGTVCRAARCTSFRVFIEG